MLGSVQYELLYCMILNHKHNAYCNGRPVLRLYTAVQYFTRSTVLIYTVLCETESQLSLT